MDKCEWCNTELYKPQYYGNADFDMEKEISRPFQVLCKR